MAAREAAQLTFNIAPAYPTPPTVPNAPGAALTRKAETPSAPRLAVLLWQEATLADLVEVRISSGMRNRWTGDVQIVAATKDSQTEYWVAATRREEAVAAVHQLLVPGWTETLTDRRISPAQVAVLHLRPNGVRKLRYVP
jgi:hypothetical protein